MYGDASRVTPLLLALGPRLLPRLWPLASCLPPLQAVRLCPGVILLMVLQLVAPDKIPVTPAGLIW
jgi:hypothetical protein